MTDDPLILAIDQGTTSSRAMVFDSDGVPRASAQKEIAQIYPADGWVEHDPEEIWSSTVRGAVVLIASDGWDADPPAMLERRMARLKRMSHRIIWVNPRSAADDFEPLVGGMAIALPLADELLSGHTLNAMRDVIVSLGSGCTSS